MDAGIESKEVKPKFERVIQFQEKGADGKLALLHTQAGDIRPINREDSIRLKWNPEGKKGEVTYSELTNQFKSPSQALKSFHAAGLVSICSREVCRSPSLQPGIKPVSKA